jgi:hypothetical protein
MSRFAFGNGTVGNTHLFGPDITLALELFGKPADAVVVFTMDHDEGAMSACGSQNIEDLVVFHAQTVIGHVNLEAGVAVSDEGREFLAQHLLVGIRKNHVEAVVDHGFSCCLGMIIVERLAQGHAWNLLGKGNDGSGAAAGGCDTAGTEIIGQFRATKGWLSDMTMSFDPTGQDQTIARIDHFISTGNGCVLQQRDDRAVLDGDIGRKGIGGCRHRSVLDEKIVVSHGLAPNGLLSQG